MRTANDERQMLAFCKVRPGLAFEPPEKDHLSSGTSFANKAVKPEFRWYRLKIRREKSSQRRHHRLAAPLTLRVNDVTYPALDWSLGGFRIAWFEVANVTVGDQINVEVELPFQGFEIAFIAAARIVRVMIEEGEIACAFEQLSQRQTDLMNHFISEIVSGNISAVDDTLQRIDSPVTPASLVPDANPALELPVRRWNRKQLGMSAFYFSLGFALVCYFSLTIYSNFFSMKLESGVVSAPLEQVVSPTDGKIRSVSTTLHQWVPANAALIFVEDPELEEDISFAEIRVERAEIELEQARKSFAVELDKASEYEMFATNNVAQKNADLQAAALDLKLAGKHLSRVNQLVQEKMASDRELDEARAQLAAARRSSDTARIELSQATQALETLRQSGRFFTGERFEGESSNLQHAVQHLTAELELARKELIALQAKRERINIAAPTDGRLVELTKRSGSAIRKGEVLGYFEREEARVVEVFLTQSEVLNIALGQKARVYLPAVDKSARATVVSVDRSRAFLDGKAISYNWRGSEERTAKVTLWFEEMTESTIRDAYAPGTPAVVLFPGQANSVLGELMLAIRSEFNVPESGFGMDIADR